MASVVDHIKATQTKVSQGVPVFSQQLLLAVTEQLKVPLLQIARQAEYANLQGAADAQQITETATTALRLLDSYALGVRLSLQHDALPIEPVSLSSVLYDSGQQLDGLAKRYGVSLELRLGRFGPVMAHKEGLEAALVSLGAALIEALPAQETQLTLQLATHRCRYGIVAGMYTDNQELSAKALRQGRNMLAQARQPLASLSHSNGAGIFVADALLAAMQLRLQASRHHGWYGLGAVLQPNHQLQLV
jgi:hypothetical protein